MSDEESLRAREHFQADIDCMAAQGLSMPMQATGISGVSNAVSVHVSGLLMTSEKPIAIKADRFLSMHSDLRESAS